MSAFAVFGLCLVIVIVFLIIVGIMMGPQFFMLFIYFPVLISEAITGQRGSFHPNGATKKKPFFEGVFLVSIILQVVFLSGVLFGLYWLIAGVVGTPAPTVTQDTGIRTVFTPSDISQLVWTNTVLWLFSILFAGMLIFNTIRYWKEINLMPGGRVLTNYVWPLLMFLVVFFFLFSSRNYLTAYPQADSQLSVFLQAIAIFYGVYLLLFKIRDIYLYFTLFQRNQIPLWKGYWFTMFLSTVYMIVFQYYLIQLLLSV